MTNTEWKECTIGDIADVQTGPFGSQLHEKDYVSAGTPIVTVEHLGNRTFSTQNLPMVSDSDKSRLQKYCMQHGDLIFSRVGSVDRCTYANKNNEGWLFSGRCLRVRPQEFVDSMWLYYFFCLESTKTFIRNIAVGATMPSINTKLMCEVPVKYPPLAEQQRIAKILSALDDKIELNNAINRNLEEQAQAIFKNWFVDFEPFGGEMPRDWKTIQAQEYFTISIGKTPPRKEQELFSDAKSDDNLKWVSISDMGSCGMYISDSSEYLTKEAVANYNICIIPDNTVILSFKLTVGRIAITDGEMTSNEAIAHFCSEDKSINEYLYCYLKNFSFETMGSTSSIATAVNSKIIKAMPFILPIKDTINRFHKIMKPLFDTIRSNQQETKKLISIRDGVLPKLMSGKLNLGL